MFSGLGLVSCDPCVHQCEETKGTNSTIHSCIELLEYHILPLCSSSSFIFFQHSFASRYSNDTEDPEASSLSLNEWLLNTRQHCVGYLQQSPDAQKQREYEVHSVLPDICERFHLTVFSFLL